MKKLIYWSTGKTKGVYGDETEKNGGVYEDGTEVNAKNFDYPDEKRRAKRIRNHGERTIQALVAELLEEARKL